MEIRAFRGWRYCVEAGGDISAVLAPPFDTLSDQDKRELLARSERNIVAVDLPHVPPIEAGPEEAYRQAAQRLNQWKSSGVLCQEQRPALYAYQQSFRWGGRSRTRRAMLCGVRITPLGQAVIPHERIFAGPTADRLKLTQHTKTQLSPIFGFFHDLGGQAMDLLFAAAGQPVARGQLRDVPGTLWAVTEQGVINEIASLLRDVPVFIADGHHRYTTALSYRDGLRQAGRLDDAHEANFALFALVARDDPGLVVLPTHRIVRGLRDSFTVERLIARCPQFTWQRCSVEDADLTNSEAFLRRYGRGAMAFIDRNPAEVWIVRLTDPAAMAKAAPDQQEIWRQLDVAVLHKIIIDAALEPWRTKDLFIEYTPEGPAVLAACNSGRAQLGICLQATPLEAVEAIARAGASMPNKSTYFYPKPATGMVLKGLE